MYFWHFKIMFLFNKIPTKMAAVALIGMPDIEIEIGEWANFL